jgi:DNA-binding MarR family transcriptional regulator
MSKNKLDANKPGRFAYEGLDRIIHEKARLGIVTSLSAHAKGLLFNDLKGLCQLTDGNLARHLQTLEEAGLVELSKEASGHRTQTLICLTPAGRRRFLEYITVLESIVSDALEQQEGGKANKQARPGWSVG